MPSLDTGSDQWLLRSRCSLVFVMREFDTVTLIKLVLQEILVFCHLILQVFYLGVPTVGWTVDTRIRRWLSLFFLRLFGWAIRPLLTLALANILLAIGNVPRLLVWLGFTDSLTIFVQHTISSSSRIKLNEGLFFHGSLFLRAWCSFERIWVLYTLWEGKGVDTTLHLILSLRLNVVFVYIQIIVKLIAIWREVHGVNMLHVHL